MAAGRDRQGELVRKVFEILLRNPSGTPAHKVLETMEQEMTLTDAEASFYPNRPGVRRFEKIVRFSTIAAVKAGWMVKDRGVWTLTENGRIAYTTFKDPGAFMREAGRLYRRWRDAQPETDQEEEQDTPTRGTTLEEAEESSWTEISAYLDRMSPYDFQDLVAGLLRGMGYHVSWVAPPGPDKGVDILAHHDPLGVQGSRIKVQVKRRGDKINVNEVRSFLAVLGEDDVGIFVTTTGFTPEAEATARGQEKRRIMLLDARRLLDLWIEHYERIPEAPRRLFPLRPIHFLAPEE